VEVPISLLDPVTRSTDYEGDLVVRVAFGTVVGLILIGDGDAYIRKYLRFELER
jgi:hypothetical protein